MHDFYVFERYVNKKMLMKYESHSVILIQFSAYNKLYSSISYFL